VPVSERLRQLVDDEVRRSLQAQLGARGLLLTRPASKAATADAARSGAALLRRLLEVAYPEVVREDRGSYFHFADHHTETRIGLTLAFGAVTAELLTPLGVVAREGRAGAIDMSCATFNLGVGLVDGICDSSPQSGLRLLDAIQTADLVGAARERVVGRWLRVGLPPSLAADPSVQFAVRAIEAFFELLHSSFPGEAGSSVRDRVGARLAAALDAERQSVDRSGTPVGRDRLVECSRRTSVLPFQVIEDLATGNHALPPLTAGTLIGEAMWRIDDLVDLVQDVDSAALNGVLLTATAEPGCAADSDGEAALQRVIASQAIPVVAGQAAEYLQAGLIAAPGGTSDSDARRRFLSFVQRYAGLQPAVVRSPTAYPNRP
jgi:hypothetical protein